MTSLDSGTAAASEQVLQPSLRQVLQQSQDVRFLGDRKIGEATEPGMKTLLDHPKTKVRVAAINKIANARLESSFLNAAGGAALKRICEG
jgi:hypothetical protein